LSPDLARHAACASREDLIRPRLPLTDVYGRREAQDLKRLLRGGPRQKHARLKRFKERGNTRQRADVSHGFPVPREGGTTTLFLGWA
jgi:hypothetical protein